LVTIGDAAMNQVDIWDFNDPVDTQARKADYHIQNVYDQAD